MDSCTDEQFGWTDGWMDGWMDAWTEGCIDGRQMDGQIGGLKGINLRPPPKCGQFMEAQMGLSFGMGGWMDYFSQMWTDNNLDWLRQR